MDNKILTFGKYKNYKYIDVYEKDKDYCEWILKLENYNKNTYILTFKKYILSKNKVECVICYDMISKYKKLDCCNNIICNICLIKINNFICPFCRKDNEIIMDEYIKEIKYYIIEKEEKIKNQESLKITYFNKCLNLEYKNNKIMKDIEEVVKMISLENLDKELIIELLEDIYKQDGFLNDLYFITFLLDNWKFLFFYKYYYKNNFNFKIE